MNGLWRNGRFVLESTIEDRLEQMNNQLTDLKKALQAAILKTNRTVTRCIDYDPAGSTYEIDWTDEVKEWAKLCDLDLEKYDPPNRRR